jgi:hypothetical protein
MALLCLEEIHSSLAANDSVPLLTASSLQSSLGLLTGARCTVPFRPPRQYDIFKGTFGGGDAIWLEAVEGLGMAYEKMKARAEKVPGKYFVFCQTTHVVQATADTSAPLQDSNRKAV